MTEKSAPESSSPRKVTLVVVELGSTARKSTVGRAVKRLGALNLVLSKIHVTSGLFLAVELSAKDSAYRSSRQWITASVTTGSPSEAILLISKPTGRRSTQYVMESLTLTNGKIAQSSVQQRVLWVERGVNESGPDVLLGGASLLQQQRSQVTADEGGVGTGIEHRTEGDGETGERDHRLKEDCRANGEAFHWFSVVSQELGVPLCAVRLVGAVKPLGVLFQ
ncbi:hypothetical protein TYRP_006364 [Tyrophagus putrescentiae]|nr:hypothetical protein TYRP_006364 [Tyrophagus putrescentiae]